MSHRDTRVENRQESFDGQLGFTAELIVTITNKMGVNDNEPERRITRQRAVILDVVLHSHAHPDAEEVHRLARKKIRSLSLGTVYRNLKLLAETGQIREVQLIGRALRYDGMLEDHEHFLCTNCNGVIDLPQSVRIPTSQERDASLSGCEVHSYRLDLYGLCSKCVATKGSPKR